MEVIGACATVLGLLQQAVQLVNSIQGYRQLPVMIQDLQRELCVTKGYIEGLYQAFQARRDDQDYMGKMRTAVSQYLEILRLLVIDINNFLYRLSEQSRIHMAVSYFLATLGTDISNFRTRLTDLTTLINTAFTCYEQVCGRQMQDKMAHDLSLIVQQFTVKSTAIGPSKFVADTPFFVNEISFNDMIFNQTPIHTSADNTVQIYEATFEGEAVVVKVVHMYSSDAGVLNNFMEEIRAATKLTNKHVVQVYAVCRESKPDRIGIVMEKMEGNLRDLLQQRDFDWRAKIDIALHVAQGLRNVHANGMMHGNLMARNVFYNQQYCFKIGDFHAAKKVIGMISLRDNRAISKDSLVYMAPELVAVTPHWSKNADIFSFGVLLWELATRQIPIFGEPRGTDGIPYPLVALITACCAADRTARPDIHNVILQLEEALKQYPQYITTIPTIDIPNPAPATAAR